MLLWRLSVYTQFRLDLPPSPPLVPVGETERGRRGRRNCRTTWRTTAPPPTHCKGCASSPGPWSGRRGGAALMCLPDRRGHGRPPTPRAHFPTTFSPAEAAMGVRRPPPWGGEGGGARVEASPAPSSRPSPEASFWPERRRCVAECCWPPGPNEPERELLAAALVGVRAGGI